jgi:hypothetical protein
LRQPYKEGIICGGASLFGQKITKSLVQYGNETKQEKLEAKLMRCSHAHDSNHFLWKKQAKGKL